MFYIPHVGCGGIYAPVHCFKLQQSAPSNIRTGGIGNLSIENRPAAISPSYVLYPSDDAEGLHIYILVTGIRCDSDHGSQALKIQQLEAYRKERKLCSNKILYFYNRNYSVDLTHAERNEHSVVSSSCQECAAAHEKD